MKLISTLRHAKPALLLQRGVVCIQPTHYKYEARRTVKMQGVALGFRPWVMLQNAMFGLLIRGYFQQQFNLKEFVNFCPYALASIAETLESEQFENLSELTDTSCKNNLMQNWEDMRDEEKETLKRSKPEDYYFYFPTLGMKVTQKTGAPEVQAILAINIKMINYGRLKDIVFGMVEKSDQITSANRFVYLSKEAKPAVHTFSFVREMTRGVEDSWKMVECGIWPNEA